jgi:hypothetical protein
MPDSNAWAKGIGGHAHNAISQELVRAGLDQRVDAKALANALMADSPFAKKKLNALLDLGNPGDLSQEPPKYDLKGSTFGVPNKDIFDKQYEGYPGRGWDYQSEAPAPRELSVGGKMADQWGLRRDFLKTLIDPSESARSLAAYTGNYDKSVQAAKEGAAQTYMAGLGRDKGESGWFGAMSNPSEYTAGKAIGMLSLASDAFMSEYRNPRPYKDPLLGEQEPGYLNYLSRVWHRALPEQYRIQEAAAIANKVDPMLPPNAEPAADWREREKQLRDMRSTVDEARPLPYSYYYRNKTGEYPSYAGEVLAELAGGAVDPLTLVSLGAASVSRPIKVASRMAALKHALTAAAKQGSQELAEEAGMFVPVQAGLRPPQMNPFLSGNENRPDLPQFDPTPYSVDGNFKEFYRELNDRQTKALQSGLNNLIDAYPKPKQQMYY